MTEEISPQIKTDYAANSHKSKKRDKPNTDDKKVDRVIEGKVVVKKRGFWRKLNEALTSDDSQSVGSYIMWDVLIPAFKSMILDAGSQGLERALYGEVRAKSRPGEGRVAYNRMYKGSTPIREGRREISNSARRSHDFREIILETRSEAEEVIDRLVDLIDSYDVATVSDLYDLVGITGNFVDEKWGWNDLRSAKATRVREGYLLELPRPEPID